jgi:hypothetical protein
MQSLENLIKKEIKYPKNLSNKDIELILEQCKIQNALNDEQIEGFANAYAYTKEIAGNEEKINLLNLPENVLDLINKTGEMIELKNKKGFRTTPVKFKDGSMAITAENIEQAIKSFCEIYSAFIKSPIEDERLNSDILFKEFEQIHPWEDGNGRNGDLLWKLAATKAKGKWPEELPPNIFNEDR